MSAPYLVTFIMATVVIRRGVLHVCRRQGLLRPCETVEHQRCVAHELSAGAQLRIWVPGAHRASKFFGKQAEAIGVDMQSVGRRLTAWLQPLNIVAGRPDTPIPLDGVVGP